MKRNDYTYCCLNYETSDNLTLYLKVIPKSMKSHQKMNMNCTYLWRILKENRGLRGTRRFMLETYSQNLPYKLEDTAGMQVGTFCVLFLNIKAKQKHKKYNI